MATPASTYAHLSEAQRTFTTPQDFYRLRDFGLKFEATISFLRQHGGNLYRVLLVPLLVALVPLILIAVLFAQNFSIDMLQGQTGSGVSTGMALMIPAFMAVGLLILAALMVQYVMLYGFVKRRMQQPDPQVLISAAEAWDEGKRYLLPLLGYSIIATVLVGLGFLLLALPGIYLAIALVLLPSVVVFEDADLGGTFSRCLTLIKGKWWSTFGLWFVASMAVGMVSGGVGMVISILGAIVGIKDPNNAVIGVAVAQAVQMGINFLLYPVLYVLLMFQYFNLVERKDYVSLQWRAEQLGQTAGGPAAGSASDDSLFRPSYGDQTL